MSAITAQQVVAKIQKDMPVMDMWSKEVQDSANREGFEDCKFVDARFQKGKLRVNEYMVAHHTYIEIDDYSRTSSELLRFQQSIGAPPQGNLVCQR